LLRKLQYWIEAAGFFAIIGLFSALGLTLASAFGGWLARTLGPLTPMHARARRRMQRVLDNSDEDANRILRDMWDNLGRTIGELPHLEKFKPFTEGGRVEFDDFDIANEIKNRGTGAIWVSGHFANWELMPSLMTNFGLNGAVVYRPPNNPYVDRYLVNLRRKYVCPVQIPKGPKGVRDIITVLKNKGHLGMLVDQRMSDGIEVPFFGIPTMTPAAPAQLALHHHVPIIVVSVERIDGPYFRARLYDPIEPVSTGDREADMKRMMARVNLILERCIRVRPDEWLWLHRRWPND
jgi:KDO2-lipid IV(A) lauroyltransferase